MTNPGLCYKYEHATAKKLWAWYQSQGLFAATLSVFQPTPILF
jgi:hypothetical protein